jgi:hypothetical protein
VSLPVSKYGRVRLLNALIFKSKASGSVATRS